MILTAYVRGSKLHLFYFILFYFILFYFILFYFILFYFILFYFILFYFILFFCMVIFEQDQEGDKDKAATSKKVSEPLVVV